VNTKIWCSLILLKYLLKLNFAYSQTKKRHLLNAFRDDMKAFGNFS